MRNAKENIDVLNPTSTSGMPLLMGLPRLGQSSQPYQWPVQKCNQMATVKSSFFSRPSLGRFSLARWTPRGEGNTGDFVIGDFRYNELALGNEADTIPSVRITSWIVMSCTRDRKNQSRIIQAAIKCLKKKTSSCTLPT